MEAVPYFDDVTAPGCVGLFQTRKKNGQGRECFAPGCSNTQLDKDGNPSGIHFFRFPQDEPRRTLWCQQIKRQDTIDDITANSVLCEQHFKKDDIRRTPYGANRYFLKKDSIPQQISDPVLLPRRGRKASKPQRYEDFIPQQITSPVATPRRGRKASKPQRLEGMGKLIDANNEVRPKTHQTRDQKATLYGIQNQTKIARRQEGSQTMSVIADAKYRKYSAVMTKLQLQSDWLDKMNKLRKEGLFCDIHLDINGRAIKAHRIVLSACSPLFHKQLATGGTLLPPDEAYTSDFVQALDTVIEFAYTAEIHLTAENVQHIMQIAFHYQILPLVDMCSSFVGQLKQQNNHVRVPGNNENGFNMEESMEVVDHRDSVETDRHGDVNVSNNIDYGSDQEEIASVKNSNDYEIAEMEERSLINVHAADIKQQNGLGEDTGGLNGDGLLSLVDTEAENCRVQEGSSPPKEGIFRSQQDVSKDDGIQLRQLLLNRMSAKSPDKRDLENQNRGKGLPKDRDMGLDVVVDTDSLSLGMWASQFDENVSWKRYTEDSQKMKGDDEEDGNPQGTLFLCVDCGKSFPSKSKLLKHEKCHSKDVFRCKHCFEKFPWKHSLEQHIMLQHPDVLDSQENNSNDALYPNNAVPADGCYGDSEVELDGREKEKVYFCGICGRGFSERYRQMRHEKIHTREKPFKCSQCEKVYSRKDNLDRHFFVQHLIRDRESKLVVQTEGGDREEENAAATETTSPEADPKDGNTVTDVNDSPKQNEGSSAQTLTDIPYDNKNETTYAGEQNYVNILTGFMAPKPTKQHVCLVCGKEFTNKYRLVRHEVIHTGERPYKCEICNRKFTRKDHMERHKSRQHPNGEIGIPSKKGRKPKSKLDAIDFDMPTGVPEFQCPICGMVFQNQKSLTVHKQCHEFVDCKGCRTIFLSEEDFRTHQCIGEPMIYSPQPGPSNLHVHQMDVPT
ncbi:uncharacterized protein LOC144445507 [Glandiceps talaboti]